MPPTAPPKNRYHHGDLRTAIIDAALELMAERGVEDLSLRACAQRAGVSHAAPAYHFNDRRGLLSAIAAIGFERLTQSMQAEKARGQVPPIVAISVGYVRFALENPGHFALIFRSSLLDEADPALTAAGAAAYGVLEDTVAEAKRGADEQSLKRHRDALWSIVHGYASLILSQQIDAPKDLQNAVEALVTPLDV